MHQEELEAMAKKVVDGVAERTGPATVSLMILCDSVATGQYRWGMAFRGDLLRVLGALRVATVQLEAMLFRGENK